MTSPRTLAVAALLLGGLAAVAGRPVATVPGSVDVSRLASMIVREQDHVDAIDLARWIQDRRPGLRVVDVRAREDFETYRVPTAENIPLDELALAGFAPTDTVVLYSGGGAHAAQAWILLRALGVRHVYFLSGGLDEWIADVMEPLLPDDATPEELAAFQPIAEVSRYFGGTPRTGPRADAGTGGDGVTRMKRRGC
jgi:rhodanese-related sulfurtransferase